MHYIQASTIMTKIAIDLQMILKADVHIAPKNILNTFACGSLYANMNGCVGFSV